MLTRLYIKPSPDVADETAGLLTTRMAPANLKTRFIRNVNKYIWIHDGALPPDTIRTRTHGRSLAPWRSNGPGSLRPARPSLSVYHRHDYASIASQQEECVN